MKVGSSRSAAARREVGHPRERLRTGTLQTFQRRHRNSAGLHPLARRGPSKTAQPTAWRKSPRCWCPGAPKIMRLYHKLRCHPRPVRPRAPCQWLGGDGNEDAQALAVVAG
eukprot:2717358-Pyramimonas_sp.AAC.1